MKKFRARDFIGGVIVGSLLFSGVSYASSTIKLIVDGKEVNSDVPPQIIGERTMVPARFLAESLGAKVEWDLGKNAVIVTSKEAEKNPVLETDYISFPLLKGWTYEKGLDSFAIKKDGSSIGTLNTLAYAPTVESLLPNGAEILEKKQLDGTGVPVYSVKLVTRTSAASQEPAKTEIHYFYFLDNKKVVYDLTFNLDTVTEDEALEIAKNVKIKGINS